MVNNELPDWASIWVLNKRTGEIRPAAHDMSTGNYYDEEGTQFGTEWNYYLTPVGKRFFTAGFIISFTLLLCIYCIRK